MVNDVAVPLFPTVGNTRQNVIPNYPANSLGIDRHGFTIIELSIVLVIVGLVIGGVLVGRDLIAIAQARGLLNQINDYNTAVYTFRNKYNALPGDLSPASALAFGFTARAGSFGRGDSDGQLMGAEALLFWSDLSAANLINNSLTGATDADNTPYSGSDLPTLFPKARTGRGYVIAIQNLFHKS